MQVYTRNPVILLRLLTWQSCLCGICITLVAFLLCRKLTLKGIISWGKTIAYTLLIAYYYFLILSTVICRRTLMEMQYEFMPFWSYCEILNGDTDLLIENVLNIFMMIPVGVLLYICFYRLKQALRFTLVLSLVLSSIIEILQLILRRGMFEFDDMIHNTIGALIGFTIIHILCVIIVKRKENGELK